MDLYFNTTLTARDTNASGAVNIGGNTNINGTLTVGGRNILAELDAIKNNYVAYNANVSARPNNDSGKCFDFGSDHRTSCDNGWSIIKIVKR